MLLVKSRCYQREMENIGVSEYLDILCAAVTLLSTLIVWMV